MKYKRNIGFELIESLEAEGRRTFTLEEVTKRLKMTRKNALAVLGNLKRSKRICTLTKGLYALWHPSERKWGVYPLPIIDALMHFRKSRYYVGLLSSADHYGAAHHKPQVLQVIISKQVTFRKARELAISIHVSKNFPSEGIDSVKAPSGNVAFSSPELTALDLFYFESACGGFDNICLVLKELLSKMRPERLKKVISAYAYPSSIQRLGYVFENFGANEQLMNVLREWVDKNNLFNIALSSGRPKKGKFHPFWKIIENASLMEEE